MSAAAANPPLAGRIGRLALGFLAGLVVLVLGAALAFKLQAYLGLLGPHVTPEFGDFDLFRLIGRMGLNGHMADAYDAAKLGAAQVAAGGAVQPWAYPPQFDLITMGLALIGPAEGFALFMGLPLLAYVVILWLLSGRRPEVALIVTAPALLITVMGGQNGFVTASLAGGFALLALRGNRLAGLVLGFLAIKPHLGLGLGLWTLFRGRWAMAAGALGVVAATSALATAVLGPAIWGAFLGGLHHTTELLRADGFHLSRLISIFAALRGLGVGAGPALTVQALASLACAGLIFWAVRRRLGVRAELGLAMLATLMLSPYGFDYDLTFFGLALALLWPVLAPRLRPVEGMGLLALALVATGTSLGLILAVGDMELLEKLVRAGRIPVLAGPAILGCAVWSAAILARPLPGGEGRGEPA